jgi:two-component SAPR family response regulator
MAYFNRLCIVLFLLLYTQGNNAQGLLFTSNDVEIGKRTSWEVFAKEIPVFSGKLVIEFDMSIIQPKMFGHVFRLIDQSNSARYSLVVHTDDLNGSSMQFNIEGEEAKIIIPIDNSLLGKWKWIHVSLAFDMEKDSVTINVDGQDFLAAGFQFGRQIKPAVYFGKSGHFIDVPAMKIRDLKIYDAGKQFRFPLDEIEGTQVHDDKGKATGVVDNPSWLMNDSYRWKRRWTYFSQTMAGVTFDERNHRMVIFNKDSLITYDFLTDKSEQKVYRSLKPFNSRLGTNFIHPETNELYVYEVNELPVDAVTMAVLDMDDLLWKDIGKAFLNTQRHHHSSFFDGERQRYCIFGGYGNWTYSNELYFYDFKVDTWQLCRLDGDFIAPRFFSSLGVEDKDNVLIFGGIGNESGKQDVGKNYFYDLYRINLRTQTARKLWTIEHKKSDSEFVPVRNMVITEDSKAFYTLCYPEYQPKSSLRLYKFGIEQNSFEVFGDSIPIISEEIWTNAGLYYDSLAKEFYCYVLEYKNNSSVITLYSLSAPPMSFEALQQKQDESRSLLIPVSLLLTALLGCSVFVRYRKKGKTIPFTNKSTEKQIAFPLKNAFYLFGEFLVYDRKGVNITHLFPQKIKQLFLLALFNSIGQRGVKSNDINAALWPGKPMDSAKNLKGVTVSNLRKALEDIDGIELVFEDGYFRVSMDAEAYCDYTDLLACLKGLENNDENTILRMTEILKKPFIPNMDNNIFDKTKDELEEKVVFVLKELINQYKKTSPTLVGRYSFLLLQYDFANEEALYYFIHSYVKLKELGKAKKQYDSFVHTYKSATNENYPFSFEAILKMKSPPV